MEYHCIGCHSALPDFERGQAAWLYHNGRFYCPHCSKIARANKQKPVPVPAPVPIMPKTINRIIEEIDEHPDYRELPRRIRKDFYIASRGFQRGDTRNSVENAYIRSVWKTLYVYGVAE